jgi:hypothetical protein
MLPAVDETSGRHSMGTLGAGLLGGIFGALIMMAVYFTLLPAWASTPATAPAPSSSPSTSPLSGLDVVTYGQCPANLQPDGSAEVGSFGAGMTRNLFLCKIP